jgi:hypothetical protein
MTSRNRLALLLVTPLLALSACGGGSDKDKITDLVKKIDKDASTICDNATNKLLSTLGSTDIEKCKAAARGYSKDDTKITGDINVKVAGGTATATFKTSDGVNHTAGFVKEGGDWKVDSSA